MAELSYSVGPIRAGGAFTADFALPASLPLDQVAPLIERDRAIMATRPGMRQKHLPIRIEQETGNFLSGGRYLFDTAADAARYKAWVEQEFVVDGTKFFDRPYFLDPVYYAWEVIGAHDLGDLHSSHVVARSERWRIAGATGATGADGAGPRHGRAVLEQAWPGILREARQRGLTSVWLLYQEHERLAGLVSVGGRVDSGDPAADGSPREPDFPSLLALELAPSLGRGFEEQGWTRDFDRTSWILTIWLPLAAAGGAPSLWPNSPPFPAPVAEPSLVG